jgi:predicted MFS family arabinose efflux permease
MADGLAAGHAFAARGGLGALGRQRAPVSDVHDRQRRPTSCVCHLAGTLAGGLLPGRLAALQGQALSAPAPYRVSLWLAALLFVPAPLFMGLVRRSTREPTRGAVVRSSTRAPLATIFSLLVVVLLQFTAGNAIAVFANVYLDDALGVPTATVGAIKAIGQLLSVPAALLTPWLLGRWRHARVYPVVALGVAASLVPVILFPGLMGMAAAQLGVMSLNIIAFATISIFQMEAVVPEWRPAMSAAMSLAMAISSAAMAYTGGHLIAAMGYRVLFGMTATLTALGAVLFCVLFRRALQVGAPRGEAR